MKRLFLVVIILFCLAPSAKAQETCDTAAWAGDVEVYLEEFTADIESIDPNDIPGMTEFYSRLMDALHYYEDLDTCADLDTANGLMISVLNGMQDRLFYVMSTLARSEGLQINASIVETSVQPRYDENLALLNAELDSMSSTAAAPSGLAGAVNEPTIIGSLESSNPNDIFGPFEVATGFYIAEFDIEDSPNDGIFSLSIDWGDDGFFYAHNDVLSGRQAYYFPSGSVAGNASFSDADSYTITLSSAPLTEADSLSLNGTSYVHDVLGPLFLDAGSYILDYQLTYDGTQFQSAGVTLQWITAGEYVENILVHEEENMEGRQLYELEGGVYFINYQFENVSDWSFSLTPVE